MAAFFLLPSFDFRLDFTNNTAPFFGFTLVLVWFRRLFWVFGFVRFGQRGADRLFFDVLLPITPHNSHFASSSGT